VRWRIGAVLVSDHYNEGPFVALQDSLDGKPEPRCKPARALVPFEDVKTESLGPVSRERELQVGRDEAIAMSTSHAVRRETMAHVERAGLRLGSGDAPLRVLERLRRFAWHPMSGLTAFTVPGAGAPGSFVTTEPIGELEFERTPQGSASRKTDRGTRHNALVAALATLRSRVGCRVNSAHLPRGFDMGTRTSSAARAALLAAGIACVVHVGPAQGDTRVTRDATPGSYVRYDGGTDATLLSCSTGRRTQNEPSVAVDPRNASIVIAGSNDYCAEIQNGSGNVWGGYYRSTDGGVTWTNSLVPGYPADGSPAGTESPTKGSCAAAGDPTQAFDGEGRLFYGFICFNRAKPTNGSIYVATYDQDGARYLRTVRVDRGTPSVWGLFQDKINVTTDQASGNVYVLWAQYPGQSANNTLHFARSTDHGATFSKPVRITPGLSEEQFADATVGPDGALYVTYRTIAHQGSTADAIWLVRSTDGGESFSAPRLVAAIAPFDSDQFSGNGADTCGDGPFACPSGLTFARFSSQSAVAADATGVHVVYSAETPSGQAKIYVRSSPDGLSWSSAAATLDDVTAGHQFFPDVTSAAGTISVVFQDSRSDPAYSPSLPPGNTAAGVNSGNVVHAILAQSGNGGVDWTEQQLSTSGSNPNWEVRGSMRSPFFGDYNYASAVGATVRAVWSDSRDLIPGSDPREVGEDDDADGFDGLQTCTWVPNDIDAAAYSSPTIADACLSQGGLDQNVYIAP
jgi:hypothetical protein